MAFTAGKCKVEMKDAYFYANNLLDKEYFSTITYRYYTVGAPRTLGVVASVRF